MKWFLSLIFFCASSLFAFYSQASQDEFVHYLLYELANKQDPGYYLEIGAWHPALTNNTYFLEKEYGWIGISFDISDQHQKEWLTLRHNPLLIQDATKSDYSALLQNYPAALDYLSLDVDGYYDTVLKRIPLDRHIFSVITIEHDYYRYGDQYRMEERKILSALGYHLLCPDVCVYDHLVFEDWWIHPSAFPDALFTRLISLDLKEKQHDEILNLLKVEFESASRSLNKS